MTATCVPTGPLPGVKLVIVGGCAGTTVKLARLRAPPPAAATPIRPLMAPGGTVTVICVGELGVKLEAGTPLKATADTLTKLVPVITTCEPTGPLAGAKPVMVGAWE